MNTIIESIRAAVERRRKQMDDASFPPVIKMSRISELSIVLDILDDIQERTDNPITFTLQEQPVCEGLEEEIERYIPTSLSVKFPTTDIETIKSDIRYIARHFAQWQKEKMMKEAVDATVIAMKSGDKYCQAYITDRNSLANMCNGDHVKLIIVKEVK